MSSDNLPNNLSVLAWTATFLQELQINQIFNAHVFRNMYSLIKFMQIVYKTFVIFRSHVLEDKGPNRDFM